LGIFFKDFPMTLVIRSGSPTASQQLIPPAIDTIERLCAWCLKVLYSLYKSKDFFLVQGDVPVKQVARNEFTAANGQLTEAYTIYFIIDPTIDADRSKKSWMFTQEISSAKANINFDAD
jgi:hypothetical protein